MTRTRGAVSWASRARAVARVSVACAALALASCGGPGPEIVAAGQSRAPEAAEWPPVGPVPPDAATVKTALGCADGAQVTVRAYLVAVTVPCPACNVGERSGQAPDRGIGRSARQPKDSMPGCLPCPLAAATFSDDVPTASAAPVGAPLRAIGSAEALQARHVGKMFVLTGTFRVNGSSGPELDVTEVRAVEVR